MTKTVGYNTLSVRQAQAFFGIKNVPARIAELRREGYPIYTNTRTRGNGTAVSVYRLGKPSRGFRAWFKQHGIKPRNVLV